MECQAVISNQMIKYQLSHMRFNQNSDLKHEIYLNGKLSTKPLGKRANKNTKNTKLMFTKCRWLFFLFVNMVSEVTVRKNFKQTFL